MVTKDTIEEGMLNTLEARRELALAAVDLESEVGEVALSGGIEALKRRLEVLIGEKPPAPVDESRRQEVERELRRRERQEQIARADAALYCIPGEVVSLASICPSTHPATSP